MAMAPLARTDAADDDAGASAPGELRWFVFALFFIFGGITSLNDVLIPKLKGLFDLSYAEAMLIQSAFFAAYFFISFPAAAIVRRAGYMRTAAIGLLVMTAGCLLFVPAAKTGLFITFLLALFVLGAGITIVQVVANPLISMLGAPKTASSRLTFAQGFNSLGTTLFPHFGAILILGSLATVDPTTLSAAAQAAYRATEASVIGNAYVGIAIALVVIAAVVFLRRNALVEQKAEGGGLRAAIGLLRRPRFAFGTLGIFLYVGAEVSVGSVIVNYLMRADTLGLTESAAGTHIPYYWGGAMIGRFIGAALLRYAAPAKVLAGACLCVLLLLATSATTTGLVSAWSLLAIGLFNSVMFPTIFSLASERLGVRTPEGSGLICMAIVGGAIVPPLTGLAADGFGLKGALLVPALCYAIILCFGLYARRPAPPLDPAMI